MALDAVATIPELVHWLARRHGDTDLVEGPDYTLTYREVEEQSAAIAQGLLSSGLGKGSRIGILMPNSPEWIVSWLGALRIGALVSGLSTFVTASELDRLVRFADLDTLLMVDRYLRHDYVARIETAFPELTRPVPNQALRLLDAPFLRSIWVLSERPPGWSRGGFHELVAAGRSMSREQPRLLAALEDEVRPADEAIVVFTSGSVAEPQGVVHTHGAMVRQAIAVQKYCSYEPGQRVGVVSPLFWVGGMLTGLLITMLAGGTVVFPAGPDPVSVLEMIRTKELDYLVAAAGPLRAIADHRSFRPDDFFGLSPSRVRQARLGLFGPQPEHSLDLFPNSLGMTETFGPHSAELPGTVLPDHLAGSFGRAVVGVDGGIERRIMSPETAKEVAPGEIGELVVRGGSVMKGYYKREREDTFDQAGFLWTGDLCSLNEDGYLFFTGRSAEIIRSADANVSPREVELELEALPEVSEAAVIGHPDEIVGELVVGVVVAASDRAIDEQAMRESLRGRLSSYKVPRRIWQLPEADMPRTGAGKIDKPKLRSMVEALLRESGAG